MFAVTNQHLRLYQHVCFDWIVNTLNHMRISAENRSHCQMDSAGWVWAPSCVQVHYFHGSKIQTIGNCMRYRFVYLNANVDFFI